MRIHTDTDKCVAVGLCVLAAPTVFDQNDEDGVVIVLNDHPGPEEHAAVRDAVLRCPAAVIRLEEPDAAI